MIIIFYSYIPKYSVSLSTSSLVNGTELVKHLVKSKIPKSASQHGHSSIYMPIHTDGGKLQCSHDCYRSEDHQFQDEPLPSF